MQPHLLENFLNLGKLGEIWANLDKIWTSLGEIGGKSDYDFGKFN